MEDFDLREGGILASVIFCKCCLRVRAISESWNDKLSGNMELASAEDK